MNASSQYSLPKPLLFLIVAVGVFLIHNQLLSNGFINLDDPPYVTENRHVLSGLTLDGIRWAFTAFHSSNWHPLTWLSHMLDVQLYGMNPRGHHLTNLLLHTANTLLLLHLLSELTGRIRHSLVVALLFALHPLHVESVAWVAERKDVLSGFFWMVTLLLYHRYCTTGGRLPYVGAILAFSAGLMAKPMLVTLPAILLILDWWPLQRFGNIGPARDIFRRILPLVREKIPFLLLSIASCVITYSAQHQGGAVLYESSLLLNLGNAVLAYARYIVKMLWPVDLAILYPFDPSAITAGAVSASIALICALSIVVIFFRRTYPYLATGWFWYLVTLLPVIGIVRIGYHAYADRYTYLPLIGLYLACVWGGAAVAERFRVPGAATTITVVVVLAILAMLTVMQEQHWESSITLYEHALKVTQESATVHKNLGLAYGRQGNAENAALHGAMGRMLEQREIAQLYPGSADVQYRLGNALAELGRYQEALQAYRRAVSLRPGFAKAYNGKGIMHARLGERGEALEAFRAALRFEPDYDEARTNILVLQQMDAVGKGR